jgi:hypothetical protein
MFTDCFPFLIASQVFILLFSFETNALHECCQTQNYHHRNAHLVVLQGSLDALNEILKEPVPMNRFRPK